MKAKIKKNLGINRTNRLHASDSGAGRGSAGGTVSSAATQLINRSARTDVQSTGTAGRPRTRDRAA